MRWLITLAYHAYRMGRMGWAVVKRTKPDYRMSTFLLGPMMVAQWFLWSVGALIHLSHRVELHRTTGEIVSDTLILCVMPPMVCLAVLAYVRMPRETRREDPVAFDALVDTPRLQRLRSAMDLRRALPSASAPHDRHRL